MFHKTCRVGVDSSTLERYFDVNGEVFAEQFKLRLYLVASHGKTVRDRAYIGAIGILSRLYSYNKFMKVPVETGPPVYMWFSWWRRSLGLGVTVHA